MAKHLQTLIAAAADSPDTPVADLPLMDEQERHQVTVQWNDTARVMPHEGKCVHEVFEEQVERTPHAVAVEFGGAGAGG